MMNKNNKGITLIELMIALAVIGILASVAWPSYQSSVQRSYRADALGYLIELSALQTRFKSNATRYASSFAELNLQHIAGEPRKINYADGRYHIELIPGPGNQSYQFAAVPQGSQQSNPCKTYLYNNLGQKQLASSGTTVDTSLPTKKCWSK